MKKKLVLATLLSLVMVLTFTGCKKDVALEDGENHPDHFEVSDTEYGDEIKGIELTAVSDIKDSIKKENLYIFVLGNENCPACVAYKEYLKELEDTEGVRLDYIDISVEDRDEVQDLLFNVLKQDPQQGISTPTTFFIRNGEVVDTLVGAVGAEVIMEEYGDLIKEFAQ